MFHGGSVHPAMAHVGVKYLGTTCSTSQLLEQSMQGQGVETGAGRVLVLLWRPVCASLCFLERGVYCHR